MSNQSGNHTEEKVERLLYSLSALADIGEATTAGSNFETTARELLHLILGTLAVSKGAILLYDKDARVLRIVVSRGIENHDLEVPIPRDVAKLLRSHDQPLVLDPTDGPLAPFVQARGTEIKALHAHVWSSLHVADKLIGVLSLSEKFGKKPYGEEDFQLLNTITHHTSIAIYNYQIIDEIRQANFKLNRKVLEMEALYDLGLAISSLLELDQLTNEIIQRAVMLLDASRGALFLVEDDQLRVAASFGIDALYPTGAAIDRANVQPRELIECVIEKRESCILTCHSPGSGESTSQNSLIVPILIGQTAAGALMVCDKESRDEQGAPFTAEDEQFLTAIATQAAIAIDNARLHQQALEKERIERELEVAAAIQQRLLPESAPVVDGVEMIGTNVSCRQVGGDYYDYIQFEDGKLGIVIADVSGKGTPAALLVSTLQASFHALLQNYDLSETVTRLNKAIFKASPSYNYITFFYGILDLNTRDFASINAGHNDPLLLKAETGEWQRFSSGGFCLGMFDFATYERQETTLSPGDLLFLYTDGVTESTDLANEEFGEERALKVIEENRHKPIAEISDALSAAIADFVGEAPQHDDLTFVLIRMK